MYAAIERLGLPQRSELLLMLVAKDLKVRYKQSLLGYMWAVANPLAFATVYFVAFKLVMRVQVENYAVFLLSGMFPWLWLTNSVVQGTGCFRANPSLVKKVRMDRRVLPLASAVHEMTHFFFALPVLGLFLAVSGEGLHLSWLWQVPLMMALQLAFVFPLALLLGLANVFVRDVEHLVGVSLQLLFFLTPIVYPARLVPPEYAAALYLNPLAPLIRAWRSIFLDGRLDPMAMAPLAVFSVILWVLASWARTRWEGRIAELL